MADIDINIVDTVVNLSRAGFGIPALFSEEQQFKVLNTGSGKSQLTFVTVARGDDASIEIVKSGSSITFSVDSSNLVTINIPTSTDVTAKEVKDEFDDSASTDVTNLIDIQLENSGSGVVSAVTETALASVSEFVINTKSEVSSKLLPYYDDEDATYLKMVDVFNQDLSPEKAYVFNAYESPAAAISTKINEFDNQDFYFLMLTDTTKARAIEAANWVEANNKLLVVTNTDSTLLDDLSLITRAGVWLTTDATTHPEAALTGLQAPKIPGSSTWKFQQVNGIAAETDSTLISAARNNNGNIFIKKSGLTYNVEGILTNGTFIDQQRSRDYIKARVEEAFLALFVQEDKIPYDDSGIAQLVGTLADELNAFGDQGIIAVARSQSEVENSFNGIYQFQITAPTRGEVLNDSSLGDIPNREYTLEFSYVEAGAIHDTTVTGNIVLELAG